MRKITTQKEIRSAFLEDCQEFKEEYKPSKKHNSYSATVRTMFNMYVDNLNRESIISDSLANRATL